MSQQVGQTGFAGSPYFLFRKTRELFLFPLSVHSTFVSFPQNAKTPRRAFLRGVPFCPLFDLRAFVHVAGSGADSERPAGYWRVYRGRRRNRHAGGSCGDCVVVRSAPCLPHMTAVPDFAPGRRFPSRKGAFSGTAFLRYRSPPFLTPCFFAASACRRGASSLTGNHFSASRRSR